MRILIVAATSMEVSSLTAGLSSVPGRGPGTHQYERAGHGIDVLVTGVGMVPTAAWCSRVLAVKRYDLGLNFGVCGSFDRALQPGSVVHVVSDRIAELGAEDGESFLTMQELHLPAEPDRASADRLVNVDPPANAVLNSLPAVDGITVNTVHGNERSIGEVVRRFNPRVESMEGAAFMYACMIHGVAFAQVRAVSNLVEKRNRGAWNVPLAVRRLGETALSILDRA